MNLQRPQSLPKSVEGVGDRCCTFIAMVCDTKMQCQIGTYFLSNSTARSFSMFCSSHVLVAILRFACGFNNGRLSFGQAGVTSRCLQ